MCALCSRRSGSQGRQNVAAPGGADYGGNAFGRRVRLARGYLAMASPAALNQWLQALNEWLHARTGIKLLSIKLSESSMVVAILSDGGAGPQARVGLTVGSRGLIGDRDISPAIAGPVPGT